MSETTNIEWTDVTDNIIVAKGGGWWCRKISEGCANCYAAALNQSDYFGGNHLPYAGKPPELKLRTEIINSWARQTKPKKHFVASMTDIFGDWVPSEWIFRFLDGMVVAPKQTFQLLTKRADVMQSAVIAYCSERGIKTLPPNIWGGVSVENQKRGDERIPLLLGTPFAVRFLSVEPLLEHVNLKLFRCLRGVFNEDRGYHLDWCIVGGESGPGSRPCEPQWIRSIVQQCRAASVPVFVNQLGANVFWNPNHDAPSQYADHVAAFEIKHKKGGDPSEWPEDLRVRQFPEA